MWALGKLLFVLCVSLNCGTSAGFEVFAYKGTNANVSCSYPEGYESYEKYLCSENCADSDVLVTTTQGQKNRYSITDNRQNRIFTTSISKVDFSDAGKYWCGVTRNGKDIYTEVKLHVKPDECCDSVRTIEGYQDNNMSISCPFGSEFVNSFKYFCKGSRPSTCRQQALVTTNNKHSGQFTLYEDKEEFSVTVTGVTKQNAGSYLCGVQGKNNNLDVFSRVELTVTEWCCVTSRDTKGVAGQSVTLQCPYPSQHTSKVKFLCKGNKRNNCQKMVTGQGRFRLQDAPSSSSFSVTITELQAGDAGTYWCGSDSQWTPANYTKIQLSVDAVISHIVFYVVPAILLLVLIVISVILYKCCCVRAQGASGNNSKISKEEAAMTEVRKKKEFPQKHYNNREVFSSKTSCSKEIDHPHQEEALYENYGDENIYVNN